MKQPARSHHCHCPSEDLEAYSLGRAFGTDLEKIEEHLLVCGRCRNQLTLTDQYIRAMRKAAGRYKEIQTFPVGPHHREIRAMRGGGGSQ